MFTVEHPQIIRNSHSQQLDNLAAEHSSQQFAEEGVFGHSLQVKDEACDGAGDLQGYGTFLVTVNFDAGARQEYSVNFDAGARQEYSVKSGHRSTCASLKV